jgi:hypothetical protein
MGGNTTFNDIFAGSFRALLEKCMTRIDEVLARAATCLPDPLPSGSAIRNALSNVIGLLHPTITLRALNEMPQASWPIGLADRARQLYDSGFYVNFQMIPDVDKEIIAAFFAPDGDDFLAQVGSLSLENYFGLPRSSYSETTLNLLYRGRRLGVLICHEQFAATSAKGRCWNGSSCVDTTSSKVCSGDAASSDHC